MQTTISSPVPSVWYIVVALGDTFLLTVRSIVKTSTINEISPLFFRHVFRANIGTVDRAARVTGGPWITGTRGSEGATDRSAQFCSRTLSRVAGRENRFVHFCLWPDKKACWIDLANSLNSILESGRDPFTESTFFNNETIPPKFTDPLPDSQRQDEVTIVTLFFW